MKIRFLVALLTAVLIVGCSDDTGILVEVRGTALQVAVAKLETMVIVDDGSGNVPTDFDWGTAQRVESTVGSDTDLRQTPYTVLLRPDGVGDDATVWVTALAYDADGTLVGWGQLDTAISFEPDLVKKVALELHGAAKTSEGCIVKNGVVVVRTSQDCDRDGANYDVDCNDGDPTVIADVDGDPAFCQEDCDPGNASVYPGNEEVCDAFENDCDDTTTPPPELCAVVERNDLGEITRCELGARLCSGDGTASASYGSCISTPISPIDYHDECSGWEACNLSGTDVCLVDGRLRCHLAVAEGGVVCVPAVTSLAGLVSSNDCSWELIGNIQQGSWNVGLRAAGTGDPITTFVPTCDPELVVEQSDLFPRVYVLEATTSLGETFLYSVVVEPRRKDCDPDLGSALDCVQL